MYDLERLLKDIGLNQKQLSELFGVSQQAITNLKQGKMQPPYRWKELIKEKYQLDFDDYFKPDVVQEAGYEYNASEKTQQINGNSRPVPLIGMYAYASYLDEWDSPEWLKEREHIYTTLPEDGNYFWFQIKGDSMSFDGRGSIEEGDFILARELYRHLWQPLQLRRVKVWIILHRYKGLMCKEIIKQNSDGSIICHSWNPEHQDFILHLDDILKLFYFKEIRKTSL